jgi:hypothetical protein
MFMTCNRWILSSLELDVWNNIFDKNHQTKGKLMEELYQLFPFACYKVRDIRLKGRLSSNMPAAKVVSKRNNKVY